MISNRILNRPFAAAVLAVVFVFSGCQDESFLETTNINQPDESRALASPADVESLVKGSVVSYFAAHDYGGYEHLLVSSDVMTCSWGNALMKESSSEPRVALPNTTSHTYSYAIENNWYRMYRAISSANDGLRAIEGGMLIGENGADNERAKAFAKLIQGMAHGLLACFYDKAFIFDETVDLNTDQLELKPYTEVMAAAISQLEEAASIADANSFTMESWWSGLDHTNEDVSKLAHSFAARYLAQVARNPVERAAVDWGKVITHVSKGITESLAPHGDGYNNWIHSGQEFHNDRGRSWARLDYKFIGGADASDGYKDWLATDVQARTEFFMEISDKRVTTGEDSDGDGLEDEGLYAGARGPSPFRANRGTYHFSRYSYHRYEDFAGGGYVAPIPILTSAEMDFLHAEALLHQGKGDEAAAIIDKYHADLGGYPSSVGTSVGSISDVMGPIDGPVSPGSLWSMLKYNKMMEVVQTGAGIEFYDVRGWGDMTNGTAIHHPVPAKELGVLQKEIYTFGGVGGTDAAPGNSAVPRSYHGPKVPR
ncbi:MAG: hypothetical protein VX822_02210 [Candidatus Neomarinimicrobiota bacterium]|nr:hypothetical protein [Candidatus Neomarinimicrobiota bacterium]